MVSSRSTKQSLCKWLCHSDARQVFRECQSTQAVALPHRNGKAIASVVGILVVRNSTSLLCVLWCRFALCVKSNAHNQILAKTARKIVRSNYKLGENPAITGKALLPQIRRQRGLSTPRIKPSISQKALKLKVPSCAA